MKLQALLAAAALCTGCGAIPGSSRCELSDSEDALLRSKVKDFLRTELEGTYTYYDTDDSLLSVLYERRDGCGLLIYPGGDSEDGRTLLHGEGKVLFDRETLEPTELIIYGW